MSNLAPYAKAVSAAIGAGLTAALSYYPHASWIPIAAAVCTLLATYAVPNVPKQVAPGTSPVSGNLLDTTWAYPVQNTVESGQDLLPGMAEIGTDFYERVNS